MDWPIHGVREVAYRLDLLFELKMHPVFHVSQLQPWAEGGHVQPPPIRLLTGEQLIQTVDGILDHCSGKRKNLKESLIRWEGLDKSQSLKH